MIEAGGGLVLGAGIAALTKNPALLGRAIGTLVGKENPMLLGESMKRFVAPAMKAMPWLFGGMSAVDIANRLGSPALDVMRHPDHLAQAQKQFAGNLTGMIQDYSVMGLSGLAGARFAFERTPAYINRGPAVGTSAAEQWYLDRKAPLSGTIEEVERIWKLDAQYDFAQVQRFDDDVVKLYERRFPKEERQPIADYKEMIEQGHNTVVTLREKENWQSRGGIYLGTSQQPDPGLSSNGLRRGAIDWLTGTKPPSLRTLHGDFFFVREDLAGQGLAVTFTIESSTISRQPVRRGAVPLVH